MFANCCPYCLVLVLFMTCPLPSSCTSRRTWYWWLEIYMFFFTFAKRPSAGCPECICNRPRPWRRPCVSDWGCGAVILLSRGEFGREKNKICYQRGGVWTFCYVPNLYYNIVILQHIFISRYNRCERSYFVFNLGSFARNRECETQVCVFGVFFWKYLLKNKISIYANHICSTFTEKILQ